MNKTPVVAFKSSTFRYVDDVLPINESYSHSYVNSILQESLKLKIIFWYFTKKNTLMVTKQYNN